jgi:flagellar hook-length control protein FliK
MLSLLTPAAPTKAATGAAPDSALPGGRADEPTDGAGSFARALQDSSAALQQGNARVATADAAKAAKAAKAANAASAADAADPAASRTSRRAGTERLRPQGLGGGTPAGLDTGLNTAAGRTAKAGRAGLPGDAGDLDDPSESAAAAATAAAAALPATDTAAPAPATVSTLASGDSSLITDPSMHDAARPPRTDVGSAAAARGLDPAAALPQPGRSAETKLTSSGQPARPASFRASPEPSTASDASAARTDIAEAAAAAAPATGPSGAEGTLPDGACAPGIQPVPSSTTTPPSAMSSTTPAATTAASTAPPAPGTGAAAMGRTDAARRLSAAPARGTTAPETRTAGDAGRRTGGRADSASDPAGTGVAAPSALPAPPTAVTEPRAARQATADAGRPGAQDHAIERAGNEAPTAPSSATAAAPPATAPVPRFADHLQAALPATPMAVPAEGSSPAAAAQAQLAAPLHSPDFPPALGAQISLFARNGMERATIEISPPEMGPISVQIALDGSSARVDFLADAAATRQVIEAALPTLASSLREAGLTLTGGGVFQQPQSSPGNAGQGGHGQPGHGHGGRPGGAADEASGAGPATVLRTTAQRGLVDLVA